MGTAGEHGTGFRLPLAQRVLERHGGVIARESWNETDHPTEHGTVARVSLRRAPAGAREQSVQ